ncbi:MAG: YitT family protein [Bulleidia sp.]|nr:YitT family protein [Bulleidia sp.]
MRKISNLVLGSVLLTVGIWLFVTPNHINFGGMIGLSQLIEYAIKHLLPVPSGMNLLGIINFTLNIPLFIMAYIIMNRDFCIKTLVSLAIQTVLLSVLPAVNAPVVEDMILNVVFGAMICGIGVGLALSGSGCCGGMDIATVCLVKKKPDFKTGQVSIYFNIVLFGICLFVYDVKTIMYSAVFVGILYTVADHFHYQNINVTALIFTKEPMVKQRILKEMGRGVTCWKGEGAYTSTDCEVLFVALNAYEESQIEQIIHETDPHAFVTYQSGAKVHGGFEKRL